MFAAQGTASSLKGENYVIFYFQNAQLAEMLTEMAGDLA